MKQPFLSIQKILEDFALYESWQDRYGYLIDIGAQLPDFPPEKRIAENAVSGCASATWLWCETHKKDNILTLTGESEAMIVKGLIVILRGIYHRQTLHTVITSSPEKPLTLMGLEGHLSAQRTNGLHAMISHIRKQVQKALL